MPYRWKVLLAVAFGTYVASMDFSIVAMALPRLADDFDRSPATVVWLSLLWSIVVTGLTLTAGRAGDLYGRKRMYVGGFACFTVGMALAPLAQNFEQLLAVRLIQTVGIAGAIACGQAIVASAFPVHQRGRALGLMSAVLGAGLMTGPLVGGLVLTVLDWHAIFYLRVPAGLLATGFAAFLITGREEPLHHGQRLDIPGACLLFVTLTTGLLAVNRGASWGWTSPGILGLLAIAALAMVAFVRLEGRSRSPIIDLALFRLRDFSTSVGTLVACYMAQAAITFLMPFYLTDVLGYSAAKAGLVIGTVPLMLLAVSPFSGYVSDRFRFRHQVTVGLALAGLGLVLLGTLGTDTPVHLVMARLAVAGTGIALFLSPNSVAVLSSVPTANFGTASAAVATARNMGSGLGVALASAIFVGVASASAGTAVANVQDLPPAMLLEGVRAGFFVAGALMTVAAAIALASPMRQRRDEPVATGRPAPVTTREP